MTEQTSVFPVSLAFCVSVLVLTGCSISPTSEANRDPGLTGYEGYVEIYKKTVANFPEAMPEGVTFPKLPPEMGGSIGKGNGAGAAYFYWQCAWEDIYLHSPDIELKQIAITQLRRFPETSWAAKNLEDPEGLWDQLLDEAELGDPSILGEFYQNGCSFYREQNG